MLWFALSLSLSFQRLRDVHIGCKPPPASIQGQTSLIDGSYEYYHYMQDKFDDKGERR